MCPGVVFLCLYFLRFVEVTLVMKSYISSNLVNLWLHYLQTFTFPLLCSRTPFTFIFNYLCHWSSVFLKDLFSLCFNLVIFYCCFSSLLISFAESNVLLIWSSQLLLLATVFLSLKHQFGYFLKLHFFLIIMLFPFTIWIFYTNEYHRLDLIYIYIYV
jgi:hypothetical protein